MKRADWKPILFVGLLVFSVIAPVTSFGQVLPSNPFKGNSSSTIDIDVTYISRSPRYDYDATKNTPAAGDVVTFTAHVRSRGTSATGDFAFKWYIDGVEASSGVATSIASGYETTYDFSYTWQQGHHVISFFADPANAITEKSEQNNLRTEHINALLVGFWIERSVYNFFDTNQYSYTQRYGITDEANSWEDWAQRQIDKWNEMLETAIFPSTPQGCFDRVRLDQVIVVADGALPLDGGLPTNHPDMSDKTVDMMWGFEKDILSTGFYNLYNLSSPFNLEPGLIHELNHARYLVDSYALNIHGKHIAVLDNNGKRIYPNDDTLVRENSQAPSLMSNTVPYYSEWEAAGWNVYAEQRPLPGWANYNAHAGLGVYLDNKMPQNNYLQVVDVSGKAVPNATIEVYRADTWPGEWHWYCKYIDNTVDVTGITDGQGLFNMGSNPFSRGEPLAWNFYYDVNFFKIKVSGQTHYAWLDIAEVQVQYFRGNTQNAYFAVTLPFNYEPNDPPTVSAGADQTITLPASAQLVGTASDDGKPNPPGALTFTWSKVSGPGDAVFTNASALQTDVSFSAAGNYILRFAVYDGDFTVSDDVSITVNPDPNVSVEITTAETPSTYTYLGYSSSYLAQGESFKAAAPNLVRVTVALAKAGNAAGDIKVSIRSTPKGSDLASATILRSAVTSTSYTSPTWCTAEFPNGVLLTQGNIYWVVLSVTSTSSSNYYRVPIRSGNPYADGAWYKGTSLTAYYSYDLLLKLAFGSNTNAAPSQALIESGPSSGLVGVSYTYQAKASDPDGDKVKYLFDWGDGQTSNTDLVSSNTSASLSHSWQTAGTYAVKVRAEDEHGLQGPWSSSLSVAIAQSSNTPPSTPGALQGPTQGNAGQQLSFSTSATDPNGERVRIVMEWGDGSQSQSDYVTSGTTVSLSHTWAQAGTYQVRAQAVDESGASSAWTANKEVQIQSAQTVELIISDRAAGGWYLGSAYSRKRQAQSFQTIGTKIVGASVALSRVGSPTLPIQVSIRSTLTGTPLASAEIQPSQVTSTDYRYPDWITVSFTTPAQVTEGSACYLVLEVASYDSTKYYKVGYNSANPYGYGMYYPDSSSTGQSTCDMACKIVFTD